MNTSSTDYAHQIQAMIDNGQKWMKDHPGADIKIQFNYSPKVWLVQAISEAVTMHTISANEPGLELIKALWTWDDPSEPTVAMVRFAVENLNLNQERK